MAGTVTIDGQQAVHVIEELPGETFDQYYVVSSAGVEQLPGPNSDSLTRALGRFTQLRFPVRQGDSYVVLDKTLDNLYDFDSDGRADRLVFKAEATIVGFERVVGAHASFDNALRVRTVVTQTVTYSRGGTPATLVSTIEEWFAEGIGLVRSVASYSSGAATEITDLREWSVGTRRSDTTAPTVLSRTPVSGAVSRSAIVTLTLSEAIADESVAASGLEVRGPGGNLIAGGTAISDRKTYTFTPGQTLANGTYTVQLTGAPQDWAGNVVEPTNWSFTLDATGPTLISTTPAANATDVASTAAVVLQFDEPVNPGSVQAGSVQIVAPGGGGVPATVQVSGNTITVTPTQPLGKAVGYDVRINTGMADLAGNALPAQTALSFTTDPGRFALPVTLAGMGPGQLRRTAMADLDNDGRLDLIGSLATPGSLDGGDLRVLLSTGAGVFSQSAVVMPSSSCNGFPEVMHLDADNRLDLLMLSSCGVQHWTQGPAGAWTYRGLIAAAGQYQWPLALPLVGSTRPGLVMLSSNSVRLFRPSPAGGFAAPETIYAGFGYGLVGDLNGDGRSDVVLADTGGLNPVLVLLLQQADASFTVQTTTMPTLRWVMLAADLNADGRSDLVVADDTQTLLLMQRADGSLADPVPLPSRARPSAARMGDIDGDGLRDLVVLHSDPATTYGFTLFTQRVGGLWSASNPIEWSATVPLTQGSGLELADFNGDGRTDILYGNLLIAQRGGATASGGAGPRRHRLGLPLPVPAAGGAGARAVPGQSRSLGASQLGSMP